MCVYVSRCTPTNRLVQYAARATVGHPSAATTATGYWSPAQAVGRYMFGTRKPHYPGNGVAEKNVNMWLHGVNRKRVCACMVQNKRQAAECVYY